MNTSAVKLCWLDIRGSGPARDAIRLAAVHHRLDGVVAADPADLDGLPPTVSRVLFAESDLPVDPPAVDVLVVDPARHGDPAELSTRYPGVEVGQFVRVTDAESLDRACRTARAGSWTVLEFRDPTKIPLEIVLAATAGSAGRIVTVATDPTDAAVLLGVLEHGPDGVMMPATSVGDAARLAAAARPRDQKVDLVELSVTAVAHVGMGERACVDTCAYLGLDEGILVGSRARAMVLCASETHPLPYMPTRPFRVNAGAIMSYTLADGRRTRYLSELTAGATVLAVTTSGAARRVPVGRVKIETRPLLSIDAVAPDGRTANLIVQDDWHVRLLGPGGAVLNSTALVPGDVLLGHLPDHDRHVGYPIDELCYEQ
jgi:3-amino-4-hydroxybenzoic acid synthase